MKTMAQLQITFMDKKPNRYSSQDLQEFKIIIERKLSSAQKLFEELKSILKGTEENNTDDTHKSFKADDGAQNSTKDETTILAHKQEVFIVGLRNALTRIDKGTYGVCLQTGDLIDKNRLLAVPHTTTCLIIKQQQRNQIITNTQPKETEK